MMKFVSNAIALAGAVIISWQSVAIYYLITGRVQAGDDQPPLSVAAVLLIIGVFLLVVGYMAARSGGKSRQR